MDHRLVVAPLLTFALTVAGPALAGDRRLAPIPRDEAVSSHGPFEQGACETCHVRADPKNPGPAAVTNETCFECHEEFKGTAPVRLEKSVHPKATGTSCVACHSPHNSKNRKLLLRT